MSRIWTILRREGLEQRRQPGMLAVMSGLMILVSGAPLMTLTMLSIVDAQPGGPEQVAALMEGLGVSLNAPIASMVAPAVSAMNFLLISQLLGMCAVLAGHTILHERQCGTLPFLLLSPIRRSELVLGKVIGAMLWPVMTFWVVGGVSCGLAGQLSVTASSASNLPPASGWWVAYALSAPSWAMFVCGLCVLVSSLARDVRAAQQGVWVVVFFATLICGGMVSGTIQAGGATEAGVALVGMLCSIGVIGAAAQVLSRDLSR